MQTAAFDVIGIFGFSKDFQATRDLDGKALKPASAFRRVRDLFTRSCQQLCVHAENPVSF